MKRIIFIVSILTLSLCANAQQDPLFSQYMFNRLIINPAFAGNSNLVSGTLTYKKQFVGLERSPETQVFTFHGPIQTKFMGLGFKAIHDKIGVTNQTYLSGIYSYHIGFANGKLSLGLEGGIFSQSIDFPDRIRADKIDNAIPPNKESTIVPDAALGIYFHSEKFYFGASAYHLIAGKLDYTDYGRNIFARLSRHYFLTNGYFINEGENIKFEPSWLLKYVPGSPFQIDFNLNSTFKDIVTMGVSYRTDGEVIFLVKYSFKEQLVLGYAFDYAISNLASYNNGSHEIMVSYNIKLLEPARKKEIDPRYYF